MKKDGTANLAILVDTLIHAGVWCTNAHHVRFSPYAGPCEKLHSSSLIAAQPPAKSCIAPCAGSCEKLHFPFVKAAPSPDLPLLSSALPLLMQRPVNSRTLHCSILDPPLYSAAVPLRFPC